MIHAKKISMAVTLGFILVSGIFCSKNEGKYCWRCQVTGGNPYRDEIKDTCTENATNHPQFYDSYNNPLNEFCQRK